MFIYYISCPLGCMKLLFLWLLISQSLKSSNAWLGYSRRGTVVLNGVVTFSVAFILNSRANTILYIYYISIPREILMIIQSINRFNMIILKLFIDRKYNRMIKFFAQILAIHWDLELSTILGTAVSIYPKK